MSLSVSGNNAAHSYHTLLPCSAVSAPYLALVLCFCQHCCQPFWFSMWRTAKLPLLLVLNHTLLLQLPILLLIFTLLIWPQSSFTYVEPTSLGSYPSQSIKGWATAFQSEGEGYFFHSSYMASFITREYFPSQQVKEGNTFTIHGGWERACGVGLSSSSRGRLQNYNAVESVWGVGKKTEKKIQRKSL